MRVEITEQMIEELAESMRNVGQLVPLLVTPDYASEAQKPEYAGDTGPVRWLASGGVFEIIDGHCRWAAAERVPLDVLDCSVFTDVAEAKHAMMLHAGIIRNSFTAYEEGRQFVELANQFEWSVEDICRTFNRSEGYVNARVAIATGPEPVARAVQERKINLSQALQILRADSPEFGLYLLDQAEVHGATARTLEVMRQNHDKEQVAAATGEHPNTPTNAAPPAEPVVPECAWCGPCEDVQNLRDVKVHWYHERELRAVVDSVAIKNVLKAGA